MKTISLKTFIETGKFGTIGLGSTKQEVIELLGQNFELLDSSFVQILKYESYEFSCYKSSETVFGIVNDWLHVLQLDNKFIEIETWFIDENNLPTFKEVKQYLEQNQIPFKIENSPNFNNENFIRCTNSNVTLDFETCAEKRVDDFKLLGIRLYEL